MNTAIHVTKRCAIACAVFLFSFSLAAQAQVACTTEGLDDKTDEELRLISEQCDREKAEQESLLREKQRERVTIERDVSVLDYKLKTSKAKIQSSTVKLRRIKNSIYQKSLAIKELSKETERVRRSISELLRKTNEIDSYSLVEAVLARESLSEFFVDADDFSAIKQRLNAALAEMADIIEKTRAEQELLSEREKNEIGIKLSLEREKKKTEEYRKEKELLLSLSKAEEEEYKKSIAEKEAIKRKIRNRIFKTVGGTEISFGDALALIQPYEERTGVESALVLAVLFQESGANGVIGGNIGQCRYNQPAPNKDGTVMSKSQYASFLAIMEELGLPEDKTPVSCPIPRDGQYGGAIGPAQFMPNTWWDVRNPGNETGYKKRVAKLLGIDTPSPFENLHAFIGTALYLSDARSLCAGPKGFDTKFEIFSCSAAKYYSGLYNTTRRTLGRYMYPKYSYGYRVASRAMQFQKDIDTLSF